MFKVLLYSLFSSHKEYVLKEFITHTDKILAESKDLDIDVDRLFIDNSPDPEFHKAYPDTLYLRKGKNIREIMMHCDNMARQRVIDEAYTHLFKLESDLFPPANIIPRLLMHEKLVVGCGYFIGHGNNARLLQSEIDMGRHRHSLQMQNRQSFLSYNGKLQPATQFGTGCILVHKSILNNVKFRVNAFDDIHADSHFHYDVFMRGITSYIDTSIVPFHINSDWDLIYNKEKKI